MIEYLTQSRELITFPCGQSGQMVVYCPDTQITANQQKQTLLQRYDQGIADGAQQEAGSRTFDLGTVANRHPTNVALLRAWTNPAANSFLTLYLIPDPNGDRVVATNTSPDSTASYVKSTILGIPSLLSTYRLDFSASTDAASQDSALVLAAGTQALQYAELGQRDALQFAGEPYANSVADSPLKTTDYGKCR